MDTTNKEDTAMKTAVINKMEFPVAPYPNAATRRELAHKTVDFLLIVACSAGIAAAAGLLITLA